MIHYETYRLSRLITIQELVSADYFKGLHPATQNHAHQEAWEMCVCMEGQLLVITNNRYTLLNSGEILLIQPGVLHDIASDCKDATAFVISFTCYGENLRLLQDTIIQLGDNERDLVTKMIVELNASFVQQEDLLRLFHFVPSADSLLGAEQLICNYLEQVIIHMLREVTRHKGEIVRTSRFKDAMLNYLSEQISAYVEDHLGEHLTVEKVASHFHYSRTRLSTLYKDATGLSIGEFISYRRICRAKVLLLEQKRSISQIAEELGFASPQYFSHKFTQAVGCSPSRYAGMVRSQP